MRLNTGTIDRLPTDVTRFSYDRQAQQVGIVHFGIGAFHRGHQAWYTDLALEEGDRDWAITGVSLRSDAVARQMNPQDGLFTVTERSGRGENTRLVGAVRDVLVASTHAQAVIARLAAPATRIVSFTITEKGYGRSPDGSLDLDQAGSGSFYPLLAQALRHRRDTGASGVTLLSCDNLAGNGAQLARLMGEYLVHAHPDLLGWFEAECTCPSTMVDRIVPATTPADLVELARRIGVDDQAAIFTEPYTQWVIEDRFAQGRPAWDRVGARMTDDVAPYETAKLRMLNGAHSALAYLGLERGLRFVHEAVAEPDVRELVERLMRQEAAPTVRADASQDLDAYADALLERFANPRLQHRLSQIAIDGSQKIPQRWLETLAAASREGHASPAILRSLGSWLRHVRGDNGPVDDPLAEPLARLWQQEGESGIVEAVVGSRGLLSSQWAPDEQARSLILAR